MRYENDAYGLLVRITDPLNFLKLTALAPSGCFGLTTGIKDLFVMQTETETEQK